MRKFKKPSYTMTPNEIYDELMPILTGAQYKVISLIARRTLGFHRDCEAISIDRISSGTGLSRQGAIDAVSFLSEQGYIVKTTRSKNGVSEASLYTLNIEGEEDGGVVNSVDPGSPTIGLGVVNSVDGGVVNSVDPHKEEIKEEKESVKENILDIDSDSSVEDLVRKLYRQTRGAKIENLRTKAAGRPGGLVERLKDLESSRGREVFYKALAAFLADDTEWLKTNHWPINAFLKTPDRWADYVTVSAKIIGRKIETTVHVPSAGQPSKQIDSQALPPEVDTWNAIVTSLPVSDFDWSREEGKNLRARRQDGRFTPKAWADVCQKVHLILYGGNDKGKFLTFRWLIKSDENWWKVYSGEYDWMAAPKASPSGKGAPAWLKKYQRPLPQK